MPSSTASIERLRRADAGAALGAGVEGTLKIQAGDLEILINETGERMLDANLRLFGPIRYTPEEEAFAKALQTASGVEPRGMETGIVPLEEQELEGGSTDVGDVSWVTPTLHVSVATAPRGVPWHAWPVVAAGGMSIGHKGLVLAAQTLAATMVDLFDDPAARAAVRAEFEKKTKGYVYRPYIPDGPPPRPEGLAQAAREARWVRRPPGATWRRARAPGRPAAAARASRSASSTASRAGRGCGPAAASP